MVRGVRGYHAARCRVCDCGAFDLCNGRCLINPGLPKRPPDRKRAAENDHGQDQHDATPHHVQEISNRLNLAHCPNPVSDAKFPAPAGIWPMFAAAKGRECLPPDSQHCRRWFGPCQPSAYAQILPLFFHEFDRNNVFHIAQHQLVTVVRKIVYFQYIIQQTSRKIPYLPHARNAP